MYRGFWQATVHGVTRVRHDLVTNPPPPPVRHIRQVVQAVKNLPADARDVGLIPGVRKISWSRKWYPTPVFLPGKFHGQRILAGYSPWGRRVGHN